MILVRDVSVRVGHNTANLTDLFRTAIHSSTFSIPSSIHLKASGINEQCRASRNTTAKRLHAKKQKIGRSKLAMRLNVVQLERSASGPENEAIEIYLNDKRIVELLRDH